MTKKFSKPKQKYPQPIPQDGTQSIKMRFKPVAKNPNQQRYMDSLQEKQLTVSTGPAGSGKSFLCMAAAIEKLLKNEVTRIVITRPIVEAGENLGFLPGTFEEKISPYLLPLLDALNDLVGVAMAKKLLESEKIEFAPLAYMRGRTFNNAFVILDEAQNTTVEQIKLFVTRIGDGSTFVVNGDVTQCDLKVGKGENGLAWLSRKLRNAGGDIQVVDFENADVVRSKIVRTLLGLLEKPETV